EGYAPAWEARARCAALRGPEAEKDAAEYARRAIANDPRATGALATLARSDGPRGAGSETGNRLAALTLAAPTDAAAWKALATWAELRGDTAVEARALDARMVLVAAADSAGDRAGEVTALRDGALAGGRGASIAIEPWLVYARLLARRGSVDAARAMAPLLDASGGLADDDPLATPATLALAAQGVPDAAALGPNASIEPAER